jgi:hypothetical protein
MLLPSYGLGLGNVAKDLKGFSQVAHQPLFGESYTVSSPEKASVFFL